MGRLVRFQRRLSRFVTHPPVRFALFSLLALIAAQPYLSTAGQLNEFRDAHVLWMYEDTARRTVLDFGQVPLWNPWFCGGLPALGSPQARFAAPPFLFTLLFGTNRAESITLFTLLLLALEGTYRYLRARAASHLGAVLAAPVFGLVGLFANAPFLGWHNFNGFALLPWALLGVRRAASGSLRGAVLIAAAFAFITGFGGTYVAPITAVACLVELVLVLGERSAAKRERRVAPKVSWATLSAAGLLAVALCAARLWPIFEELQRAPRVIAGITGNTPLMLLGSLFGYWPPFVNSAWFLVGVPAGIVALLGLFRARAASALAAATVWMWLAMGYWAKPSLFGALRQFPLFSMLRYPERFLLPATLLVALGAAWAITDLSARARRKKTRWPRLVAATWVVGVAGLLLNVPVLVNNFRVAANARTLGAIPEEVRRPFHQARGNRWSAAVFPPMSRGSISCWEAYPVPQSPLLRGDLEHETYLLDASAGTVDEREWTPNRLASHVSLTKPTRVVINQNYHRGWKSSAGTVVSERGLLAVELPAGEHDVVLQFLPRSAVGGLTMTAVASLGALGLLVMRRRRWGVVAALVLAPFVVAGGVLLVMSAEPPIVREQRGPEGEELIAVAPPPGAERFDVRFEGGVWLRAVKIDDKSDDHRVRIELDWETTPTLEPGLGFFVHIEPEKEKRIPADHPQVSGQFLLEDAPKGKILRDILLVDAPVSKRGQWWNIWVGLWSLRGDGARKRVLDANGHKVDAERVHIGAAFAK